MSWERYKREQEKKQGREEKDERQRRLDKEPYTRSDPPPEEDTDEIV